MHSLKLFALLDLHTPRACRAVLIFSVLIHFQRMIPDGNPRFLRPFEVERSHDSGIRDPHFETFCFEFVSQSYLQTRTPPFSSSSLRRRPSVPVGLGSAPLGSLRRRVEYLWGQ